jgi:hypothetical protein
MPLLDRRARAFPDNSCFSPPLIHLMRCSSPEDAAASALRSASASAEGEGSAPGVAFGLRTGVVLRCGAGGRSSPDAVCERTTGPSYLYYLHELVHLCASVSS